MKSLLASVRAGNGLDRVDHAVQLLEDEWRKHEDVPLERLWAEQRRSIESDADEPVIMLAELIRTDLRCRFARGQTPSVAGYLSRFPELGEADSRVLSLIYEEFCLKEERGDPVDVQSFCDRYPRWKESLVSQLQYHHLFSQAAGLRPKAPQFPQPGDAFEEFQLVSLLGRGGTARVFLARDLSLGGKQVVLKVSMDRGREPQAQGALDHPHIVPVNSVVFDDREMRGLSMPYRPGLPLDEVIRRVAPASQPRRALALWEALIRPPAGSTEDSPDTMSPRLADLRTPTPRGDGWEGFPVRGTYAQGVAWIVKVIADALHYAHGERTFHRDVKPANVLLTLQHGPQLLDFNLAESPHSASQAQAAMHGGTLPYMAPEQIEAFLNPELWGKVGAQADVYSLGLVLRELLTGQAPDLPAETLSPPRAMRVLLDRRPLLDVSVRRTNPAIPHALEAIVGKCLTVAPEDRYPDAGALVEDLERFLQHRPIVHAKNPYRRERCANWGVRNRLRLAVGAASLALFALLLGLSQGRPKAVVSPSTPIAEIKPAVDRGEWEIALDEEGRRLYDKVYARASRILASIESTRADDAGPINYNLMKKVESTRFKWSWLRCRVATKLAGRLRAEGSGPAREEALRYMKCAEKDIENSLQFVVNFTKDAKDMRWVEGIRSDAMLTLGELEIDMDRLQDAPGHLHFARLALTTYQDLSRQILPNDSQIEPWVRPREARLNEAYARLNNRKQRVDSPKAPPRVQHDAVAQGRQDGQ